MTSSPANLRWRSSVGKYYLYQATSTVGFVTPVFTLFLLFKEFSFAQIATLSAINWATVTLGEVPTGYVGDRIGLRNSLVVSTLLMTASLVGFLVADSFPAFVVLYFLWALGMTFTSGSESAWLYEVLRADLAEGRFTRVRGRGGAIKRWVGVVAMVAGGFLYVVDPTWPFVAAAAWHVLGVPVLLTMPRDPGRVGADGEAPTASLGGREALAIVREALFEPPLRSYVLYAGLLFAGVTAANTYVQPITVDVFETGLRSVTARIPIPPEATLGFLYAAFQAVSAVASYYAGDVERRLGRDRAMLVLVPAVGVILLVPGLAPLLAIPAFFAMRATGTVAKPIADRYLNDRIQSAGRATVLSAASMAYSAVRVPLILAGGVVADAMGPLVAVAGFGAVILVGVGVAAALGMPIEVERGETTPAE